MLQNVFVENFEEWRHSARYLLKKQIAPADVQWIEKNAQQNTLLGQDISKANITGAEQGANTVGNIEHRRVVDKYQSDDFNAVMRNKTTDLTKTSNTLLIPRTFIALAEKVACHRSGEQWSLLYSALWRLTHGEPYLLQLATDPVIHKLQIMQKNVGRDAHKMKAFVRFKCYEENGESQYIAWHKPDHKIVKLVAPFFQRRFSVMQWTIFTPDESVHWNGEILQFGGGISATEINLADTQDELWKVYYRATFNPARIKLKAMRREMPVRYWPTMPETSIIVDMLKEAPQRVERMLEHQEGLATSAKEFLPKELNLETLRAAASQCRGCDLYRCAGQTVFGIGLERAKIILVGEQPGDNEDIAGLPFVGPAGAVLDKALQAANIKRESIYLTNAVKHFKHTLRDNRRIHVSPNIHEINACKPWLTAEIKMIKPKIIVCLGLTAARALINPGFRIKEQRGKVFEFSDDQKILATFHPSAVLRAVTDQQRDEIYQFLVTDLKKVVNLIT